MQDSYGDGNDGSGVSLEGGSVIASLPSFEDDSSTVIFGSDCEGTWGGTATCACDENERVLAGNWRSALARPMKPAMIQATAMQSVM